MQVAAFLQGKMMQGVRAQQVWFDENKTEMLNQDILVLHTNHF